MNSKCDRRSESSWWLGAALLLLVSAFCSSFVMGDDAEKKSEASSPRLIDVDVREAAIKEVIELIMTEAHVQIAYDPDEIRGRISLYLRQTTVEDALKKISKLKGFFFFKEGDVYFLTRRPPAESSQTTDNAPSSSGGITKRKSTKEEKAPSRLVPGSSSAEEPTVPLPRIDTLPKIDEGPKKFARIDLKYLDSRMLDHMFNPDRPNRSPYLQAMTEPLTQGKDYFKGPDLGGLMREQSGQMPPSLFRNRTAPLIAPPTGTGGTTGGFNQFGGGFGGGGFGGGGPGGFGGGGFGGGLGGAGGTEAFQRPPGVQQIISFDPSNSLIVVGTEEGIRQLREIIELIDRPLKQVLIEAQFITVSQSVADNFGIQWQLQQGPFNIQALSAPSGSLQIGYLRGNFRATLGVFLSQGKIKVVQSPRVIALNNAKATIISADIIPYVIPVSVAGIGGAIFQNFLPQFQEVPIILEVIPTIHDDGTVTIAMTPQITTSSIVTFRPAPGITLPIPQTSVNLVQVFTTVRDGDTIVVGGVVGNNRTTSQTRIPFLSDLPLIGSIFRTRDVTQVEKELLIFVTVHILPDVIGGEIPAAGTSGGGL